MDNIFGNRFLGRKPAWHLIGTVIPPTEDLDVPGALTLAGADYEVRTTKLVTEAFGRRIDTGRVAIVRQPLGDDPEPRLLGTATKSYKPIQNADLANLLTPISEQYGWPVETIGVLGRGEKFFLTLQSSEVEVPGDASAIRMFFLITSGHDGGSAVKIATTPVRVVCQNTLIMGLAAAQISASVSHVHDAAGEVAFNVDVIARMQTAKESVHAAMRLLAAKPASPAQVESILDAAYPAHDDTPAVTRARAFLASTVTLTEERRAALEAKVKKNEQWAVVIDTRKAAAAERLQIFNDEFPAVANTPWAAYNAVVETEQYRKGASDTSIGRDIIFGGHRGQVMEAAFSAAYSIAKHLNS